MAIPGIHNAINALAVAAAIDALHLNASAALAPLSRFRAPQGRGSRTEIPVNGGTAVLIDESYNANPASMQAALETMALHRSAAGRPSRLIAVLGDMLELGADSARLHAELALAIESAGVDLVLAAGPNMRHLYNALPDAKRCIWGQTSADIEQSLLATVRAGDVVMIKGSNGSRMAQLVAALIRHTGVNSNG